MTKSFFAATLGSLVLAGASFAGTAPASCDKCKVVPPMPTAEELLGFSLSAGYDSTYLWHGTDIGDNLIWQKLEFTKNLNDKLSLQIGEWYGHLFDYTYNELDLYGGLKYNAGPVNVTVGFTWYHYFDGSVLENQYEPFVTLSSNGLPVDAYVSYYYETEVAGSYIEAGLSKTIALTDKVSLVPAVNVGYNAGLNTNENDWNHVGVRLALPIALSKNATLLPYIAGNFALSATEGAFAKDDVFLGGVSLSVNF
jgi:hypothetical protein